MDKIECDKCEKKFDVDPAKVEGGRVSCPFCGDVNRVSTSTAAASPDLPPGSGPEQEILMIHPAMFRAHPFRGLALTGIGAGGLVMAILPATSETVWQWIVWPGILMMVAAAVWWVVWYLSACLWVKLRITNKRTIRREGIVRRHTSEVLHDHVRNVEIKQNVVQRVLNVGYLGISSSGQDGIEIEIRDIPKPYELKALVDKYRNL